MDVQPRIAELPTPDRAAEQVALQVFDLYGARRIVAEAAERLPAEDDGPEPDAFTAHCVANGVPLRGASARDAGRQDAHDLLGNADLIAVRFHLSGLRGAVLSHAVIDA